jgi:dTDP-4-amino-4,6-dideoxygalactose transaminase
MQHMAFGGFQARLASRRLARLDVRNARLNRLWDDLAQRLPARLRPQVRNACGTPACYHFVARYDGDVRRLRAAALARGLDLGIAGEIMDDIAPRLGYHDCPQAAAVYASAVQIPLHDGLSAPRLARLADTLHALARSQP